MLAVFWGACFAEPDSLAEHGSESYQEISLPVYHSDSVMFADSAVFYEELAKRLKHEGDSLLSESNEKIVGGVVWALLGGGVTLYSLSFLKGGGIVAALWLIPGGTLLLAGLDELGSGVRQGAKGQKKIQQADEYRKNAEQYRTNQQQVKVDFIPMVDPFNKSVGGLLALGF